MRFSVEWVDGGTNACAEERATLCELQVFVNGENACVFYDPASREKFEQVRVPAIHLAEGIAADWWTIFGGRDREHPLLPYRTGFALPNLRFRFDGATFEILGEQLHCDNPRLRFWQTGNETLSRDAAENVLSGFVDEVVAKLGERNVPRNEVALRWSRVSESRSDPDESAFCEAAGALGVDPYEISDADASFIDAAGERFADEALIEFLAGIGKTTCRMRQPGARRFAERTAVLDGLRQTEARPRHVSHLPELHDAARQVGVVAKCRAGERSWAPSYRAAQAFRKVIDMRSNRVIESPETVARKLGGKNFRRARALRGVFALVSRDESDVRIHLRDLGRHRWVASAENFAFARALGDAVCFPDTGHAVVNALHEAERQATGRAFAAEFLAPAEEVASMAEEGRELDEISGAFNVSTEVIEHQIENQERIQEACANVGS